MLTATKNILNLNNVDPSWQSCLKKALSTMDPHYLENLANNSNWLPGQNNIFNAFSLPLHKVNYILFGESPYPRATSANGYAFWDAAVTQVWSETGLSKQVNRATSLRNIIKMLLIAEGLLQPQHTSQDDIAQVDKHSLVKNNNELFGNFINHGFLLLNASLVLSENNVRKDAIAWYPFLKSILDDIYQERPETCLILLGNIANTINKITQHYSAKKLYAEHPYNISFITNSDVIEFFKPLHLLKT